MNLLSKSPIGVAKRLEHIPERTNADGEVLGLENTNTESV